MLKNKVLITALIIAAAVVLIVPAAMAGEVVQGKCAAIDQANHTYTIEIYDTTSSKEHPYGKSINKTIIIDYSNALIGKTPEPGDVVRIAYKVEEGVNNAIRVMNITKQAAMGGH
ncbi:MAG: hypothetical protein Q7J15_04775 [Candidatus Desulfaltia sp.]|nr:hypothetical protein [Candidatus Desulfaltia sp.]